MTADQRYRLDSIAVLEADSLTSQLALSSFPDSRVSVLSRFLRRVYDELIVPDPTPPMTPLDPQPTPVPPNVAIRPLPFPPEYYRGYPDRNGGQVA